MTDAAKVKERRCIVSGLSRPADELIRFAVSPGGDVVPDLGQELPGRGLWVTARRHAVAEAVAKKRFARAAKAAVGADAELAETVERQLADRCLRLLGLARRAGELVTGFEKVKSALAAGDAAVLIAAGDAAADGRGKLERLAGDIPVLALFGGAELSLALGRENVVHAALSRGGLADRFVAGCGKLANYRAGPQGDGALKVEG